MKCYRLAAVAILAAAMVEGKPKRKGTQKYRDPNLEKTYHRMLYQLRQQNSQYNPFSSFSKLNNNLGPSQSQTIRRLKPSKKPSIHSQIAKEILATQDQPHQQPKPPRFPGIGNIPSSNSQSSQTKPAYPERTLSDCSKPLGTFQRCRMTSGIPTKRWTFDSSSNTCIDFTERTCRFMPPHTTNIFESLESCESICSSLIDSTESAENNSSETEPVEQEEAPRFQKRSSSVRAPACDAKKAASGLCRAFIGVYWTYDKTLNKCHHWVKGGCGEEEDTPNQFRSEDMCKETCVVDIGSDFNVVAKNGFKKWGGFSGFTNLPAQNSFDVNEEYPYMYGSREFGSGRSRSCNDVKFSTSLLQSYEFCDSSYQKLYSYDKNQNTCERMTSSASCKAAWMKTRNAFKSEDECVLSCFQEYTDMARGFGQQSQGQQGGGLQLGGVIQDSRVPVAPVNQGFGSLGFTMDQMIGGALPSIPKPAVPVAPINWANPWGESDKRPENNFPRSIDHCKKPELPMSMCRGAYEYYHFDADQNKCIKRFWGGCGDNRPNNEYLNDYNHFYNEDGCNNFCLEQPNFEQKSASSQISATDLDLVSDLSSESSGSSSDIDRCDENNWIESDYSGYVGYGPVPPPSNFLGEGQSWQEAHYAKSHRCKRVWLQVPLNNNQIENGDSKNLFGSARDCNKHCFTRKRGG